MNFSQYTKERSIIEEISALQHERFLKTILIDIAIIHYTQAEEKIINNKRNQYLRMKQWKVSKGNKS